MNSHLTNLKSLKFGGASCVIDPTMDQVVKETIISCAGDYCFNDLDIQNKFIEKYFSWIQNSKNNSFKNLDKFAVCSYSNGTTEGFDKFYINNNRCRFRVFRGEYMYHGATWKSSHPDWKYIEDEPVRPNDAVIISAPFSDTGNIHPRMNEILDQCHKLSIPVLVDCAFVGICGNIEFDFDHPAITDITFSLSKTFPVANLRIGMRCRRQDNDDGILIHQKTNYTNRLGSAVGLSLIEKYSVDHNFETWRSRQLEFCKELDVEPSDSVIFGLGGHKWSKYNRGTISNRLCFSRWFTQKDLPTDD